MRCRANEDYAQNEKKRRCHHIHMVCMNNGICGRGLVSVEEAVLLESTSVLYC